MEEVNQRTAEYRYSAFPMRESPMKGVLFWSVVIITIWAVYWNIGSILFTIGAALILLISLTSFFLPTTYIINDSGAGMNRWLFNRKIGWDRIRSVNDEKDGIFLSPFPVKSRLENFRGLYLPYRDNRDRIIEIIRKYSPEVTGLPETEPTSPVEDEGNSS